ncbi:MAG: hypothetical protein GEV00_23025 [Actinophytocola sp.]|nr:hypothetical protein [Actinophytocola sp.]
MGQRIEAWSGVPLRWMLRRIFYSACIAALVGVVVAVDVVTAHHYGGVPVVDVGITWPHELIPGHFLNGGAR